MNTSVDLNQKYNFCTNCEKQIRCAECGELLLPQKTICLVCGSPLLSQKLPSGQINRYTLEEKRSTKSASRKIELTLTDNAIEKAAPLFGAQLPLRRVDAQEEFETFEQEQFALPSPEIVHEVLDGDGNKTSDVKSTDGVSPHRLKANAEASDYFVQSERGILISQSPDYKGKSRKQQQERFILLYVWAYNEILGAPVPDRKHLTEAAKNNAVYDTNLRTYFYTLAKKYLITADNSYRLNPAGRDKVKQILNEIKDDSLKGFAYWEAAKSRAKRAKINSDDLATLSEWLKMPTKCDNFDVRTFTKTYHWPMFALYDLTKVLCVQNAVKPALAYKYLTERYKTVSIKRSQFSQAMSRKENADKFKRTSEGLYYLTPEAEKLIEKWVAEGHVSETNSSSQ